LLPEEFLEDLAPRLTVHPAGSPMRLGGKALRAHYFAVERPRLRNVLERAAF